MLWFLKRIVFYGAAVLIGVFVFSKYPLSIEGKNLVLFVLGFSVVSGTLQTINIWLLRKIADFDKLENIGYWARERLTARLAKRRDATFSRSAVGVALAILLGLASAYMNYLDATPVPYWLLGAATAIILMSTILLFVALYEFYIITKLQSELLQQASKNESKEKALASVRKENEEKS